MYSEVARLEIRAEEVIFIRACEDPGSRFSEVFLLSFCKVLLYYAGFLLETRGCACGLPAVCLRRHACLPLVSNTFKLKPVEQSL